MNNEKWFITEDNNIRFAYTFLRKNIEYDNYNTHLVVSMENNNNAPCASLCKLEEIPVKDFFETKEDCQFEVIRRERFENKK